MSSSEDRQARALEGILGQLTFLNQYLRKLNEIKNLPGQEEMRPLVTDDGRQVGWLFANEQEIRGVQFGPMNVATVEGMTEIALAKNRPGVGDFVKSIEGPFDIHVPHIHPNTNGEFVFVGLIDRDGRQTLRIDGIIKDVY